MPGRYQVQEAHPPARPSVHLLAHGLGGVADQWRSGERHIHSLATFSKQILCSCFPSPPTFPSPRASSRSARRFWRGCTACLSTCTCTTSTGSWASGPSPTSTPATSISTTSSRSSSSSMRRSSLLCRRWRGRSARTLLLLPPLQVAHHIMLFNVRYIIFCWSSPILEPHKSLFPPDSGGSSSQH